MRDLDAHALVPLASWSRPDPLECLEEGVLSLDGEQITRRGALGAIRQGALL